MKTKNYIFILIIFQILTTVFTYNKISAQTTTLGPNLIRNPTFILKDSAGNPTDWFKGGYGNNTRNFNYPTTGNDDAAGAALSITNYITGDAKWYFTDVAVTAGEKYQFSDYSVSNVQSIITVRYKMTDGTFVYKDIAFVDPTTTYRKNTVDFIIPTNAISLTIFHLLNRNGTLSVDQYSLNKITISGGGGATNLAPNGDLEIDSGNGPLNWLRGGWGTNTRSYSYPGTQVNGSKSATVSITSFSNGDAKWYFSPIALTPGTYTYSDQYLSNVSSTITIQYQYNDGTFSYIDLKTVPSGDGHVSVNFYVNNIVKNVTVFHLISSIGSLSIDNVSIVKKSNPVGIFTTGAISLRFDDNPVSQYEYALPKLNSVGLKGTFYIVTHQKADDGFPGYMTLTQIKNIYNAGHEIGAHTQTHANLANLTVAAQKQEIEGSRNELLSWNLPPVNTFAYPEGSYTDTTISIIKNAGFTSSAATRFGNINPVTDKYQLPRKDIATGNTFTQYKEWIDEAVEAKEWLILSFHQINDSGAAFSVSPAVFNQVIDYIVSKNIPVITISQGLQYLQ